VGADEQVCSRPAHPAPTSRTEPPKLQRKGTKEKEKANKRNLRKKSKANQGKTEKGKQGPNLQTFKKLQVKKRQGQRARTYEGNVTTNPGSSGSTDLHSPIQWLYWSSI